jgi:hypothetical protein
MHKILRSVVVLVLFVSTPILAVHAEAAESGAQEAAYGAGSVFSTLLYAPVKTGFCLVGAATSGLTLPFGGTETAGKVATAACGGTWTITPDTLRGKEPLRFMGGDSKR